jgi:hydrogenase maturation protease
VRLRGGVTAVAPPGSGLAASRPRALIGGVGYRWFGDGSFGLVATDRLATLAWPAGVDVADLGYGAIWVAQDLAAADPRHERLILIAAAERGRPADRLHVRRWVPGRPDEGEIQERIREAGAGIIDLDHLLVIAGHLEALPEDVVLIEVEPLDFTAGEAMSPALTALLPAAVERARAEALAPAARPATAGGRSAP